MRVAIVILLALLTIGCGAGSSDQKASLDLSGNWIVSTTGTSSSTITANLVPINPNQCVLPDGSYFGPNGGVELVVGVDGQSGCFLADNMGDGLLSGTGQFYYPLHAVLIGLRAPPNDPVEVQMIVVEGTPMQNVIFNAYGTLANGRISGTWTCDGGYASICGSTGGTFTGHRQ